MNDVEFEHVLLYYLCQLSNIKYKVEKGEVSLFDTLDARTSNLNWFIHMRTILFTFDEYTESIVDKRTLNRKEFLLPKDKRCVGCEDGRPYRVIKYREVLIPIYNDDYGQQDFTFLFDEVLTGGAFNVLSFIDFIEFVDRKLDERYFLNKYDADKEIEKIIKEWKKNGDKL